MEENIDLFSLPSASEYKDLLQNNSQEISNEQQLKLENSKLLNDKENLLNEVFEKLLFFFINRSRLLLNLRFNQQFKILMKKSVCYMNK